MEEFDFIQKFGFSEMYEWDQPIPQVRLGSFVSFSSENPEKIVNYGENPGAEVLGVSTINTVVESDNPKQWRGSYLFNEVGDMLLRKEKLAVGQKVYDEVLELNYIMTRPWEHYIPIENEALDKSKKYIPRTNRQEWIRVNLLGKCIVRDNGKCVPGSYCQPYDGKLKKNFGIAVPLKKTWKGQKFYVLNRLTENSITILLK